MKQIFCGRPTSTAYKQYELYDAKKNYYIFKEVFITKENVNEVTAGATVENMRHSYFYKEMLQKGAVRVTFLSDEDASAALLIVQAAAACKVIRISFDNCGFIEFAPKIAEILAPSPIKMVEFTNCFSTSEGRGMYAIETMSNTAPSIARIFSKSSNLDHLGFRGSLSGSQGACWEVINIFKDFPKNIFIDFSENFTSMGHVAREDLQTVVNCLNDTKAENAKNALCTALEVMHEPMALFGEYSGNFIHLIGEYASEYCHVEISTSNND